MWHLPSPSMRVLKENMFFVLNNKIIKSVINFSTAALTPGDPIEFEKRIRNGWPTECWGDRDGWYSGGGPERGPCRHTVNRNWRINSNWIVTKSGIQSTYSNRVHIPLWWSRWSRQFMLRATKGRVVERGWAGCPWYWSFFHFTNVVVRVRNYDYGTIYSFEPGFKKIIITINYVLSIL